MKGLTFKTMAMVIVMLSIVVTSCRGRDEPSTPVATAEIVINVEYIGIEDFYEHLSQIAIFITDENNNFICRYADKIEENIFVIKVRSGKYVVSAEYINPYSDTTNIILDSVQLELKNDERKNVYLKVNLDRINSI